MKSGVVKQKWTPEEEAALRAGVQKYGAGKWRAIQRDATYGACLSSRSNVDLKDKWRNMSVSSNGFGSREKTARALAARMKQVGATQSNSASAALPLIPQKQIIGSRFDQVILEALVALKEANGGTKKQIAVYLQNRYHVPLNFKRLLTMNLKFLIEQGKLIKMRRNYALAENNVLDKVPTNQDSHAKVATESRLQETEELIASRFKTMSMEEAAIAAAQAVADAEAAAMAAEEAARVAAIAEAEWEAAEAAAQMVAALASGDERHLKMITALRGEFAVHV